MKTGFYASRFGNELFAYDATEHDAVWLRIGTLDLAGLEAEGDWPLPEHPKELDAWLKRYNFQRVTTKDAGHAIRMYLVNVMQMISPDNNAEIIADPADAVAFVRLVQWFVSEMEDL